MKLIGFLFAVSALVCTMFGEVAAAALKITEMAVTTKIVKNNPVDSVHRISSSSVKQLYCFTRIRSDIEEDTTIKHIWYRNDEKVGEYDVPVKGTRWRTFSKKVVGGDSAGDWRVEAVDNEGNTLKTVKFRIN